MSKVTALLLSVSSRLVRTECDLGEVWAMGEEGWDMQEKVG